MNTIVPAWTESAASSTSQAWNWFHRLLLEELEGAVSEEETVHMRPMLSRIYLSMYLCEWKVGNVGTTVPLAQKYVATTPLPRWGYCHTQTMTSVLQLEQLCMCHLQKLCILPCRDALLQERFLYNMLCLREFESARFAVPMGPTTQLHRAEGASALPICHTATMTGVVSLLAYCLPASFGRWTTIRVVHV